jgi:tetratricopeptide (TPR) repeat protein
MTIIDKETFSHLVKHPNAVDPDVIPKLEATIKAFPYCQISYSLLAKASGLLGPEKLNEAKPKAAAYALSRIALQQLVENNNERYDPSLAEAEQAVPAAESLLQDSEDIIIGIVDQDSGPAEAEKSEEQKRQQKIIEGFIKNNPRIVSIKAESNIEIPQINLTGRVAQEGQGSIETEAFAKILIRQGKIEKAIDIYQKLILKKPEKKNYFAKKLSELNHSATNR